MPRKKDPANPAPAAAVRVGRLVDVSAENENPRFIDPAKVEAIDQDGQACTVHLSGGSTINVARTAADLRSLLGL